MKEFDYENIPHLLDMFSFPTKEMYLDRLNKTLKQYSKENQTKYFELITDISDDYKKWNIY